MEEAHISSDLDLWFDMAIMDWGYKHTSPFEAYMSVGKEFFSQFPKCNMKKLEKSLKRQYTDGLAEQLITIAGKKGRIIVLGKGLK